MQLLHSIGTKASQFKVSKYPKYC